MEKEVERLEQWANHDYEGNFTGYSIAENELDAYAVQNHLADKEGEHTPEARKKFEREYKCRLVFEDQPLAAWPEWTIIPEEWAVFNAPSAGNEDGD